MQILMSQRPYSLCETIIFACVLASAFSIPDPAFSWLKPHVFWCFSHVKSLMFDDFDALTHFYLGLTWFNHHLTTIFHLFQAESGQMWPLFQSFPRGTARLLGSLLAFAQWPRCAAAARARTASGGPVWLRPVSKAGSPSNQWFYYGK